MKDILKRDYDGCKSHIISQIHLSLQATKGKLKLYNKPYFNLLDDDNEPVIQKIEPMMLIQEGKGVLFQYRYRNVIYWDNLDDLSMNELYEIINRL